MAKDINLNLLGNCITLHNAYGARRQWSRWPSDLTEGGLCTMRSGSITHISDRVGYITRCYAVKFFWAIQNITAMHTSVLCASKLLGDQQFRNQSQMKEPPTYSGPLVTDWEKRREHLDVSSAATEDVAIDERKFSFISGSFMSNFRGRGVFLRLFKLCSDMAELWGNPPSSKIRLAYIRFTTKKNFIKFWWL